MAKLCQNALFKLVTTMFVSNPNRKENTMANFSQSKLVAVLLLIAFILETPFIIREVREVQNNRAAVAATR